VKTFFGIDEDGFGAKGYCAALRFYVVPRFSQEEGKVRRRRGAGNVVPRLK
jgi:hypothetical protein